MIIKVGGVNIGRNRKNHKKKNDKNLNMPELMCNGNRVFDVPSEIFTHTIYIKVLPLPIGATR